MTGLLGGAHALYVDASRGTVRNLDCFVSVPTGTGGEMQLLQVPFGEELVHYAIGAASFAVPGLPAGLEALWREHGRLPWARLVEPALRLARDGVPMPPAHAACLEMLAPVMTLREGAAIYAPRGALLADGDLLRQPGLVAALELVRDEGASTFYSGTIAEAVLGLMGERGGAVSAADLAGYEARWTDPVEVGFLARRVFTRSDLAGVPETLVRYDPAGGPAALLAALEPADGPGHTTNLTVVDRDGNACVVTSSLGLGSGDWLPGLDLHLNSMLGEVDLIQGPLVPGERMPSMMAPTAAISADGRLELALGAAGGTRLRSALVGVLGTVLHEGLDPQAAIDRPRFHPTTEVLNAEPGIDEQWLAEVERSGRAVRRWPSIHHYFGGVSAIGPAGAGADPRRSGGTRLVALRTGV
jgi:gamma-glutamyltranspeptidase/glutathione hydrolase